MQKREYLFLGLILLIAVFAAVGHMPALLADDNNSGNNSNGNGNNNQTISCEKDEDCSGNYECEDGTCILGHEDKNETEDGCEWQCSRWSECTNETKTRTCTNVNNCTGETPKETRLCPPRNKVCCMMSKVDEEFRDGEGTLSSRYQSKVKYRFVDENNCVTENDKITKEIVNDSICLQQREEIKEAIQERNRLKFENRTGVQCPDNCTCTGVVIKCMLENGTREMTVYARSGNIIMQVKSTNVSTQVTLYHQGNKTYGNFSGEIREIKIMPDEVKNGIRVKIKAKFLGEEIELGEDGNYKFKAMKKARLFWIVPVTEDVEAEIDSETGVFSKFKNGPWWGFLARDIEEE